MPLTESEVLALAPDASSAKAAQGLVKPAQWSSLGANPQAVWGACQGSGSKPYQTQVDVSGAAPSFKCSCPSRKFPCKHGLALMLLRARQSELFGSDAMPAWVSEWIEGRAERAQKKEEKQREQEAKAAERAATLAADPEAAAREAARLAAAAEKTERQRWARIDAGVADARQFLHDQLAHGLGSLDASARAQWQAQGARLVDAQAPLLGQRLRDAAELIGEGEDWPERLLAALGWLQLACDAVARRAQLSAPELADLRSLVLGWPLEKTQVLAEATPVRDDWRVLGLMLQERENRLMERRVWLQGQRSGRIALLLEHAHAGRPFEMLWIAGSTVPATLAYYPSAAPLRALVVTLEQDEGAQTSGAGEGAGEVAGENTGKNASDVRPSSASTASPATAATGPAAEPGQASTSASEPAAALDTWTRLAQETAACPWTPLRLWSSPAATPCRTAEGFALIDHTGRQAPLDIGEDEGWALLARSGGHPLALHAEWNGHHLRPLAWDGAD